VTLYAKPAKKLNSDKRRMSEEIRFMLDAPSAVFWLAFSVFWRQIVKFSM
jgi:hypothetical protein